MIKHLLIIGCLINFGACKKEKKEIDSTPKIKVIQGSWQAVESKDGSRPVARHEAAFVSVGDKFYLLGGRGIRPVSIYDPKTGSWSTGAEPPLEMHHFQPVAHQNKIYIIAALTGKYPGETPTEYIYIYDPTTDQWSKGDKIPEDRRRGSTGNILHEGKIYISCGIKNGHIGDHKNWLDRYDPSTGKWEVLADAPRPRDHFQAVVANGKLYTLAGRNTGINPDSPFGGTIAEVDVYDIQKNTWGTLPNNILTSRAGNMALPFNDEIWVVGGESLSLEKAHAEVEALDLRTYKWRSLPNLIEGRHGTGLVLFEDEIYIASGCGKRGGSPELSTMEKYSETN